MIGDHLRIVAAACLLAACLLAVWRRLAPYARWKISRLTKESQILLAKKQYAASLQASVAAAQLAFVNIGEATSARLRALLCVAAAQSASQQPDNALMTLDEAEEAISRVHGNGSSKLLPCLHARAQVLMATQRAPLAIAALDRMREIHRSHAGERNMGYATACYQQASTIVQHANDAATTTMSSAQRAAFLEQAVTLVLDASAAATASFDAHEGDEFAEALLEQIMNARGNGDATETLPTLLAQLPECEPSIRRLREHLQDHFEHFGGDERLGSAGEGE